MKRPTLLLLAALLGGASSSLDAEEAQLRAALARSPSDAWTLEDLTRHANIVGGVIRGTSKASVPYAILAEVSYAAFNVNVLRAEMRLAGLQETTKENIVLEK